MIAPLTDPAELAPPTADGMVLSGRWTVAGLGAIGPRLAAAELPAGSAAVADASRITGLDSAGAWLLHTLLQRLGQAGHPAQLQGLPQQFNALLATVAQAFEQRASQAPPSAKPGATLLQRTGAGVVDAALQGVALLSFVGECAVAAAGCLVHPRRIRWRPILFNIRSAGVDALPIVGLLAFLLGVVVAYQSADQLRQYGANVFIADIVGLSMLREFAPLITAIIVAGRSGSAYAAQIGTMVVTEEVDALHTLGIPPLDLLVLPKLVALVIALPLLTVFADLLGVAGGLLMAQAQLGVGPHEFMARFVKAVSATAFLVGIGKAPVFAVVIVVVGCFQGFRTHGGADSVGRQTTRSVVQSIFGVIVVDALFSVVFSALDL